MKKLNYAIIFVSDMNKSIGFYRDILQLPVKFESPHWTEFATEGCTVALHWTEKKGTAAPGPTPAGQCHPGFMVDDLDGFHRRLQEKGVQCIKPPQEEFGVRLAVYADPDGLQISVGQQLGK